jgi:hypothetical protein
VGLAALVVAMLPFAWSEDFTCGHDPMPPVSGIHILLKETSGFPGPIHFFFAFMIVPAVLGVLVRRTWRPWLRLAGEVAAGLVGMAGAVMCMMLMSYGRSDQPLVYPAAWIGTLSAWGIALEAWWASGEALRRGIVLRRARKAMAARIVAEEPAALRIAAMADPGGGEHAGEEEAEAALDDAPDARRRHLR